MGLVMGFKAYLVIQLGVSTLAGAAGIWLFYVQHQFAGAYWERRDQWNYTEAALQGSSFYKLPRVLQWFSGSIGFHHIHHLSPFIANYHLQECHDADAFFAQVSPLRWSRVCSPWRFVFGTSGAGNWWGSAHSPESW